MFLIKWPVNAVSVIRNTWLFVSPFREGTTWWAVCTMTTAVWGFITSTTWASGPRRLKEIQPEMKKAFLRTTESPVVSNGHCTSPERKHSWTCTCPGITCLHGVQPFKVGGRESARSTVCVFFFGFNFYVLALPFLTGSITRHDIDSPPVSDHMISIYKYEDIFMPSAAYQTFNSPICLLLIVALTFYLLMGTP